MDGNIHGRDIEGFKHDLPRIGIQKPVSACYGLWNASAALMYKKADKPDVPVVGETTGEVIWVPHYADGPNIVGLNVRTESYVPLTRVGLSWVARADCCKAEHLHVLLTLHRAVLSRQIGILVLMWLWPPPHISELGLRTSFSTEGLAPPVT